MPEMRRSHSLAHKGTSDAAAKRTRRQEDAKQRDSRLALAHLAHYLASNLQVPLSCHQFSVMETVVRAPSKGHCRRSAVAVKPAKGGLLC